MATETANKTAMDEKKVVRLAMSAYDHNTVNTLLQPEPLAGRGFQQLPHVLDAGHEIAGKEDDRNHDTG